MGMSDFLLQENSRGKRNIFSECFFHNIYSDKIKFSVVKQANLHDPLSSCCLSLFVAVKNLEKPDATFNSVQVPQSTTKPPSDPPFFQDRESDFLSILTEVSTLFPK